jgi:predicted glutamine amidotransferase
MIGRPKKPRLSYELAMTLFDYLELRGIDAAGMWGVESAGENRIIYHKEPIRSSEFIKLPIWKQVKDLEPDILLLHARAASLGIGNAAQNFNNHPFISTDRTIAMIHNGRIEEADFLTQKYQTISDTDSEVLLRMYEAGLQQDVEQIEGIPDDISIRMNGLRDIWSHVYEGAMAVAIGERLDADVRYLFLFHNAQRPIWTIDLRESLGQIVFFSSPEIWYRATIQSSRDLTDAIVGYEKLLEIPVNQIWAFKITKDQPIVSDDNFFKFEVEVEKDGEEWEPGDQIPVPPIQGHLAPIITGLDDNDEIINQKSAVQLPPKIIDIPTYPFSEHSAICDEIFTDMRNIEFNLRHYLNSGQLNRKEYAEILESLRTTSNDLKGTLEILHRSCNGSEHLVEDQGALRIYD